MSVVRRNGIWYVRKRWGDAPHLFLSSGSPVKSHAVALERSLDELKRRARYDLLGQLKDGLFTIGRLHEAVMMGTLDRLEVESASPLLGPLVDEWLLSLSGPNGISPRTKRRYAAKTVTRYRVSWEGFFEVLPQGRGSRVSDLTSGFVAHFKNARARAQGGLTRQRSRKDTELATATINRDLAALGAFMTWCTDVKGLTLVRPKLNREREPEGRRRWLSSEELRRFEDSCREMAVEWWPLFATLIGTGMRIGEAQGLRGADVLLAQRRISIHESDRRVKNRSSVRDVPVTEALAHILAGYLARFTIGPADPVFPAPLNCYDKAYGVFRRVCMAAGLHDGDASGPKPTVKIHDLRHTFGVHAALAGVPIPRLQLLLGHRTAAMTMRYMTHAPQNYFAEDAARIAASMTGDSAEANTRVQLARSGLRTA
jgi:integrase